MNDYTIVSRILHQNLGYLSKWGLEFLSEEIIPSKVIEERLSIFYKNPENLIELSVSYSMGSKTKTPAFSVNLHSGKGGFLSILEILEKSGMEFLSTSFCNKYGTLNTEEFVEKFTTTLRTLLETKFLDYISGKTPLPSFDWGPYK